MRFIKGFKKGFKEFGNNIGIIVNSILLFIVYLIGVGISSLIAKTFKKSFLTTKNSEKTYWIKIESSKKNMEDHYRQF